MAIQLGTRERLGVFVARSLAGLQDHLEVDRVTFFFGEFGIELDPNLLSQQSFLNALAAARQAAQGLGQLAVDLPAAADNDDQTLVAQLTEDLLGGITGIVGLLGPIVGAVGGVSALRVTEDLAIRGLELEFPNLMAMGTAVGVFEREIDLHPVASFGFPTPPPVVAERALHLDHLMPVLTSPISELQTRFGWGLGTFDATSLPARLGKFLQLLGFPARLVLTGPDSPRVQGSPLVIRPNASTSPPGVDMTFNFAMLDGFDLSLPLEAGLEARSTVQGEFPRGFVFNVVPPARVEFVPPAPNFEASLLATISRTPVPPASTVVLLGQTESSVLEADSVDLSVGLNLAYQGGTGRSVGEPLMRIEVKGGHLLIDLSAGDGFLKSLTGGGRVEARFEMALTYGLSSGLKFEGGAALEVIVPVHVSFAGVEVRDIKLRFPLGEPGRGDLPIDATTALSTAFGPFAMTLDGVGLKLDVTFGSGNLGVANVEPDIKFPTGIGVSIDAGGVTGGGFLSHDPVTGRYAGAIELRVFLIGVKAFGILDTRFPDGTEGVSFVVLISAEFTPIQLGFGFTLVGVGGLLGVNRTVAAQALGDAVRTGALGHLLFPRNPVQDAPAIINDLAAVFPATRDHQLFGPMAKFGWGTPTLITADIGIIIEFPGPRLALLGVVRMVLPSAEFPLMMINAAVGGVLDFPAGKMSISASLFDSRVAGYVVSGDMAYRLEMGDAPTFLLSVGGFNPGFNAPARFPDLRRASVDLGVSGNPRLTASGYFALTSNTAQLGARIDLRVSAGGFHVRGHFGFDTLFVFSPFRFTASISAGIHVDYEGFGFGVTLHGDLSGPTPWHFHGRVCVDLEIDEVCLTMDFEFGRARRAALPEMDPWTGNQGPLVDPRVQVIGLGGAVLDPRSWEGEEPEDGYRVVSLSQGATAERIPIDPVGPATLRQKVCPLNQELEKFGEYRPIINTHFDVSSVKMGGEAVAFEFVEDKFAPAHFSDLTRSQRLSSPSYDDMIAGVSVAPNRIAGGPKGEHVVAYETVFITEDGQRIEEVPTDPRYTPTDVEFLGMLKRSAAALAGVRRAGAQKYMLPGKPKLLTFDKPTFVVADACDLMWNTSITPAETTYTKALLLLRQHEKNNPSDRNRFRVVPFYAAAA